MEAILLADWGERVEKSTTGGQAGGRTGNRVVWLAWSERRAGSWPGRNSQMGLALLGLAGSETGFPFTLKFGS